MRPNPHHDGCCEAHATVAERCCSGTAARERPAWQKRVMPPLAGAAGLDHVFSMTLQILSSCLLVHPFANLLCQSFVPRFALLPVFCSLPTRNSAQQKYADNCCTDQANDNEEIAHGARCGLTLRLSDPAPVTSPMRLKRHRGVRWSRFVRRRHV